MPQVINKIVNNFLPLDYFNELKDIIEFEKKNRIIDIQVGDHNDPRDDYDKYAYITPSMGRLTLRSFELPSHIYDIFIDYVCNDLGFESDQIASRGAMFCEYKGEYGEPTLGPHYDSGDPTILLDFQVYSNMSWPIVVDDIEFVLKDNDLLNIYPTNQQHWRPDQGFLNTDVVGVMFLILHIKNLKQEDLDYKLLDKRKKEWLNERKKRKQKAWS